MVCHFYKRDITGFLNIFACKAMDHINHIHTQGRNLRGLSPNIYQYKYKYKTVLYHLVAGYTLTFMSLCVWECVCVDICIFTHGFGNKRVRERGK